MKKLLLLVLLGGSLLLGLGVLQASQEQESQVTQNQDLSSGIVLASDSKDLELDLTQDTPGNAPEGSLGTTYLGVSTQSSITSSLDTLRRDLLVLLLQAYLSYEKQTSALRSVTVSYDQNNIPSIVVKDGGGVRTDFVTYVYDESFILSKLAKEYDISTSEVLSKTTFEYTKPISEINMSADFTTTSRVKKDTYVILTLNQEDVSADYYIRSSNVKDATKKLAQLYGVSPQKIWNTF